MAELSTEDQRWEIFHLFSHFDGYTNVAQMCADAARILKLENGLTDLRELTQPDADELIAELRRALAQERVSDE